MRTNLSMRPRKKNICNFLSRAIVILFILKYKRMCMLIYIACTKQKNEKKNPHTHTLIYKILPASN